jgi:hypothetical protein
VHTTQVHVESEGFGRFEYRNGSIYEGQWKLIKGVRMKHGEGLLTHPGASLNDYMREDYKG